MSADVNSQSFQEACGDSADSAATLHWRERRRRKILIAAESLFARSSYDAVQMDDIARQAGVGKHSIYRCFASKDHILVERSRAALQQFALQRSTGLRAHRRAA